MKKILLLACVAAIACGDDDVTPVADAGMMDGGGSDVTIPDAGPDPDGGPLPDTGTPDSGTPDSSMPAGDICDPENLENVTADADMVVTTTIDTSMAAATPQALESCGSEATGQIVVAVAVPGAEVGQVVQISTDNAGTSDIDTILDMRDMCGIEGTCFDDVFFDFENPENSNTNSVGTIVADGGDTVYALISGYGADDEGVVEVSVEILGTAGNAGDSCEALPCQTGLLCNDEDICQAPAAEGESCEMIACETGLLCNGDDICQAPAAEGESCELIACGEGLLCNEAELCETAEAPVLTAAEAVRYDNVGADMNTEIEFGYTGSDANGDVVSFRFTLLDADGNDFDFNEDGNPTFTFPFEEVEGLVTFAEATFAVAGPTSAFPPEAVGFRMSVIDSTGLESNQITGDITTRAFAPVGESCTYTSRCESELVCGATELCEAPAAPVLTAATAVRYDDADFGTGMLTVLGLGLNADDTNGDVVAFNFALLDGADEVVAVADLSPGAFAFDEVTGLTTFMEAALIGGVDPSAFPAEAVSFRVSLIDSAELESNVVTGTIEAGTLSADGDACGFTELCDPATLTCNETTNMCEAI